MFRSLRSAAIILAVLVVLPLVAAACGSSSTANTPVSGGVPPATTPASGGATTVNVTLTEYKIQSDATSFSAGKSYHFVIKNSGSAAHELLILPASSTDRTQALLSVARDKLGAGATATADYTFSKAGSFEMACLLPGHYDQGMHVAISVK